MRLIDPRTQAISRIGSPGQAYRSGTICILGAPKVPAPREELQHTDPHRALHGGGPQDRAAKLREYSTEVKARKP